MQEVAESSLAYKGLSKKLFALFWPRKCSFFGGQLESGSSVINTTEGRKLSMDVSARELASTVNNSDTLDSPFQFFEAWLPGTAGRARFPAKIIPKKNTHSAYSA